MAKLVRIRSMMGDILVFNFFNFFDASRYFALKEETMVTGLKPITTYIYRPYYRPNLFATRNKATVKQAPCETIK